MSRLQQLMLETQDPYENLSLEELSFNIELLDDSLESFYAELEYLQGVAYSNEQVGLEDVVKANLGSLSGRHWDDYITTYKRLFTGIVDAVRSKNSAIRAYRKSLSDSQRSLENYLARNGSTNSHSASFVAMEKYWLYANNKYPTSIMSSVANDLTAAKRLLTEGPAKAIKASEQVNKIVQGTVFTSDETIYKSMFLKMKNIDTVESIIGPQIFNKRDLFLYGTVVTIKYNEREKIEDETLYNRLNFRNPLTIITGGAAEDVKNAGYKLTVGAKNLDRIVNTPGFKISSKELSTLLEHGNEYLDSAESYLAHVPNQLGIIQRDINSLFEFVPNLVNGKKPDKKQVKKVFDLALTYYLNLMGFVDKPMHEFVNRQIKMSKGIHYLVTRTIGRKE